MDMWIQLHDFSHDEKKNVDITQAKQALESFDWQSELTKRDQSKGEICDPGLGLVREDKTILHICPQNKESCRIFYMYSSPKKLLGFIPLPSQKEHFIDSCSFKTANELIQLHFDGKQEEILCTQ